VDRTLTALARDRYRPNRLSVLAPAAALTAGAERLARDVALRWEEAAAAFLDGLRAIERAGEADRCGQPEAEGTRMARRGARGGDEARRRPARELRAAAAPRPGAPRCVEEDERAVAAPAGAADLPPGAPRAPVPREREEGDASPMPRAPAARSPGEVGRVRRGGSWPEEAPAAWPHAAPGLAGAGEARRARSVEGGQDLPRPPPTRGPAPGFPVAPARLERERPVLEPVPASACGAGATFATPLRRRAPLGEILPERRAIGPPDDASALAASPRADGDPALPAARGVDPLAIESLLDERRRKEEALREWARTEF
jgi:hypothetical protein